MRASVEHLHALSEHVVILTIETLAVPHVAPGERLVVDDLGYSDDAITHATARFGYMDHADVPSVLRLLEQADIECPLEVDTASYFLSTVELVLGDDPDMSRWRKRLFMATAHIAADAAEYFGLPRDRTVILGSRIEI
jgi:KUP system potassium uptake protein